jgi:DNA-binding transcriptional LysR family regulator
MNLKQIETFRWVARLGGFAAAAERMNSTQSAVSIRIQELEHHLGLKLFDRSHRTTKLTAKGREILTLADDLMDIVWKMRTCIADATALEGVVRIGVADLIAITWLSEYVSTVRERYQKIYLDLEVGLSFDLLKKARRGEIDLLFAPANRSEHGFTHSSLGEVDFVWVANQRLGLPRTRLRPQDLNNWPIISLSQDSYHHQAIELWFKGNGARCQRVIVCNSIDVMLTLILDGLGIGLIPLYCMSGRYSTNQLVVLDTEPRIVPVEFYAMTASNQETPLTNALTAVAVEVSTFKQRVASVYNSRQGHIDIGENAPFGDNNFAASVPKTQTRT